MKAIFFGSPAFAVPSLNALNTIADVRLVVSQPDRPSGRGMSIRSPAVKVRADELGIPTFQPKKVRNQAFLDRLKECDADVGVVVAYGRILTVAALAVPTHGCVNVHGSILPSWRGAAPIQWAIAKGDKTTGCTLMQMDEGMDTGDMLSKVHTDIEPNETAAELAERLSHLGANLLSQDLPKLLSGELHAIQQDSSKATHASLLSKTHGQVDWSNTAQEVHDLVRGMTPWPGGYTFLGKERFKLHQTRLGSSEKGSPGEILKIDDLGIHVGCGENAIVLTEVQAPNRKRMPGSVFASSGKVKVGDRLYSQEPT